MRQRLGVARSPAGRPRAADPGRAHERPRPGRHPRVPRDGARAWSTRAARSSSRRTCWTRSRRSATRWPSSTAAGSSPRGASTRSPPTPTPRCCSASTTRPAPSRVLQPHGAIAASRHAEEGGLRLTLHHDVEVELAVADINRRLVEAGIRRPPPRGRARLARAAVPADHEPPRGGRMSAVTATAPSLRVEDAHRQPPLRLVRAELLKLRRRRGLVVLSALLAVAPMLIGYGSAGLPARHRPGLARAGRRGRQPGGLPRPAVRARDDRGDADRHDRRRRRPVVGRVPRARRDRAARGAICTWLASRPAWRSSCRSAWPGSRSPAPRRWSSPARSPLPGRCCC